MTRKIKISWPTSSLAGLYATHLGKATLVLAVALLSSCGCEDPAGPVIDVCPPGHPCQNAPSPGACTPSTTVTVVDVSCGVGVWGSYWLQLDNGDYLQPWLSNNTNPIHPGQRYQIDYGPVNRDHLYDHVVTCQAVVPAATPVRIHCMLPVNSPK